MNEKYLTEAEAFLQAGDYLQASEKFWGAAAEVVKAVAARRGVALYSHGELYRFMDRLAEELRDPSLLRLFGLASALHQNFYEGWLSPRAVAEYAQAVRELVAKLKTLS